MKIDPVGTELFHVARETDRQTDKQTDGRAEGQTDMTKLTVAFRNFTNSPENDPKEKKRERAE
jgi:hypothetical protein